MIGHLKCLSCRDAAPFSKKKLQINNIDKLNIEYGIRNIAEKQCFRSFHRNRCNVGANSNDEHRSFFLWFSRNKLKLQIALETLFRLKKLSDCSKESLIEPIDVNIIDMLYQHCSC